MTDRKKKAIDYLNSQKVKREVIFWIECIIYSIALILVIIFAAIEIFK